MASTQETYGDNFGAERMWGLKELPLPEPIGLWPLAPGWYFVASLLLILFGYWCWRRYLAWRHNAYRREGVVAIEAMRADSAALQRLPFLLRRTALITCPRADVASLRGTNWIAWLNGSAGQDLFVEADADLFDKIIYQAAPVIPHRKDVDRILEGASYWMRNHRAAV
jgi:hypothetical protein